MDIGQVGVPVLLRFPLVEADGATPLTGAAGDVTATLRLAAAISALDVVVVELNDALGDPTGLYQASFTPNTAGDWYLLVEHPAGQRWGSRVVVTVSPVDDLAAALAASASQITNRTVALPYIYITPTFLEESGLDLDALSVNEVWRLIRRASARVNGVTGQTFIANFGTHYLSGRNSPLIQSPALLPIQEILSIEVLAEATHYKGFALGAYEVLSPIWDDYPMTYPGAPLGALAAGDWGNHRRAFERRLGVFPGGTGNVKVVGAFGWMDNYLRVENVIETDVEADSTSCRLASVGGVYPRDVVDLMGPTDSVRVIVTDVNRATREISFDPPGSRNLLATIPADDSVARRLGQVPEGIEDATAFIFSTMLLERTAMADGDAAIDPTRLKKESTDGYSYELFPAAAGQAAFTGNPAIDQILMAHSRPAKVALI